MSDKNNDSAEGHLSLNSGMYFTCSSGLTPANIHPTQINVRLIGTTYYYLVKNDKCTQQWGDFFCRWTFLIAAIIVGLTACSGGAALAILAVGLALGGLLCGHLMAALRSWIGFSTLNAYGKHDAYTITSKCKMVCCLGGVVTFAPGITGFWDAMKYTARNVAWTLLEGFLIGKVCGAGGGATGGLKAGVSGSQFATNLVFLQAGIRAIAIADQVYFEGVLRDGKDFHETGEYAMRGLFIFEMPFKNIIERAASGYYTGSYAEDEEGNYIGDYSIDENGEVKKDAYNGHGAGALITDIYYCFLSAVGMRAMAEAARSSPTLPLDIINNIKARANATAKKVGLLFERTKFDPRQDPRFENLAREEGKTSKGDLDKAINEAEGILLAEKEGYIINPRRPKKGEPDLDFIVEGPEPFKYSDVKTPINRGNLEAQAIHIGEKITNQKAGSNNIQHVVDLKNIPKENQAAFKDNVIKGAGSEEGIVFVNDKTK